MAAEALQIPLVLFVESSVPVALMPSRCVIWGGPGVQTTSHAILHKCTHSRGPLQKVQINQSNQRGGSSAPWAPDSLCDPSSVQNLEAISAHPPKSLFSRKPPELLWLNSYCTGHIPECCNNVQFLDHKRHMNPLIGNSSSLKGSFIILACLQMTASDLLTEICICIFFCRAFPLASFLSFVNSSATQPNEECIHKMFVQVESWTCDHK